MNIPPASFPSTLELLFNHVTLPPQLPGKCDHKIEEIEAALILRLLNASRELRDLVHNDFGFQWDSIRQSLQICKAVNAGGKINKACLVTEFRRLKHNDVLILHIAEQNAGLLIRRQNE